MLKKEANIIVGGLSAPGKMPCPSINLPAAACITGSLMAVIEGTTCYGCYALKGRYLFKNTKIAMARRLAALQDSRSVGGVASDTALLPIIYMCVKPTLLVNVPLCCW